MEIRKSRITLPKIYQSHMMMQRDKVHKIHGTADEGVQSVTAAIGPFRVRSEVKDSCFVCEIPPVHAGNSLILSFYVNDEETPDRIISDICFGDIWLACGQSNMEYFLRYDAHWNDIKREPFNPEIRMYDCPRIAYEGQERNLPASGKWFLQGDPEWDVFSAPGYCFAREIQPVIDAPVGVIGCNWGGTPACAWIEESRLHEEPQNIYLKEYEDAVNAYDPEKLKEESMRGWEFEDSYRHELEWRTMMYGLTWEEQQKWLQEHQGDPMIPLGPYHHYRPGGLYETMIKKIAPFPVKGILWYQGESDNVHAIIYDHMMDLLVRCFRDTWEDPDLPFLYVQIAPYERWLDDSGVNYPLLRMIQEKASHQIPNAWMTTLMDLGNRDDIHPKFKREVGQRLALLARGKVYGEDILCEPPEFEGAEICAEEKEVRLKFRNAEGGLICGADAEAPFDVKAGEKSAMIRSVRAEGEDLILSLTSAELPVQILFAQTPYCEVHIWNQAQLPVKPFLFRSSCENPDEAGNKENEDIDGDDR